MSWCTKRVTNKDLMFRVGTHRWYYESVCAAPTSGNTWCAQCLNKTEQTRTQDSGTFPHGSVDGEYTEESRIFGGPKYLKYVKEHGEPSQEILALAMEAQKKARAGRKTKNVKELQEAVKPTDTATPNPEVPVKDAGVVQATVDTTKEKPKAQTTRKVKVKKPVPVPPSQNVIAALGEHAEYVISKLPSTGDIQVETTDTPMEVAAVIEVVLRPFTHNNVKYWRDSAKEKLYRRTADGKRGEYVGRWDSDAVEIVRDALDSDACSE